MLTIARRLGLNPVIVDKAETIVRPDTLEAESLLDDIKRAKQEARQAEDRAKQHERQAQLVERDLRYQLAHIEEARREVIADTRERMQGELDGLRDELKEMRRRLAQEGPFRTGNAHADFLAQADQELARRQRANEAVDREVVLPGQDEAAPDGPIEVGDRVWVASLQASGEVLSINAQTEDADVQLGNFRLKLPLKRLDLRQKAQRDQPAPKISWQSDRSAKSPGMELDLRGVRVEEGLERVERYVDDAYMARLPWVRIIHGKGTGALRDAVRQSLKEHPLVGDYRSGGPGEGGDGVTVAKLIEQS